MPNRESLVPSLLVMKNLWKVASLRWDTSVLLFVSSGSLTVLQSEASSPLVDGDAAVVVGVASLQEGLDARLHWDDRGGDWDQLVVRDGLKQRSQSDSRTSTSLRDLLLTLS